MADLLDYSGLTVVITGAATGMGHETTRLLLAAGADVHAVDVADVELPVGRTHRCDLGDPAAVDALLTDLPTEVHVLMNCAGIPNGTHWSALDIMRVNFLGLRHLTDAVLPRIPRTGAVTSIASVAGNGWAAHTAELRELMAVPGFDEGLAWCETRPDLLGDGYFFSKEAVQYYTLWRSAQTVRDGIRMNAISPGATDTKIMVDFRAAMGDAVIDMTADAAMGRLAEAHEMAPAMLFLSHPAAASYICGVNLVIDGGFSAALTTEQVDVSAYL